MAKDRRKKAGETGRTKTVTSRKRKKMNGRRIIMLAAAVFLLLFAILLFVLGRALLTGSGEKDKSDSSVNQYDTTPTALQGKVAYYVIGLLGEDESAATEMLALVCHDKKKGTLNVLEVPQDTYLGDSDLWSQKKAGYVWGNPAPLDWCDFEGKRIFKAEIEEHKAAGHTVSQRTGSASYNLISVFNELFSMPVDAYFMIPQEGFVKLVNLLGGLDVDLEAALKVGDTTYQKGVRTLDGEAALQYVLKRDKGVNGDLARLERQRKVFYALFQRLCNETKAELSEESLAPVMKGSTPIRTGMSTADLVDLIVTLSKVKAENITVQQLPGEVSAFNSDSYFSVYRAQTIEQLNTYFNPYGEEITDADVQIVELAKGTDTDVKLQTMNEIAIDQSGTAQSGTTTTTKKDE